MGAASRRVPVCKTAPAALRIAAAESTAIRGSCRNGNGVWHATGTDRPRGARGPAAAP